MRPLLKYGVPAAAGLATGGYALSQGEDPGSAGFAAIAGGLGGAAGLLGARALAGKYAPSLLKATKEGKVAAEESLLKSAISMPEGSRREAALLGLVDKSVGIPIPSEQAFTRGTGKALAAGLIPASAGFAGLGGLALGGAIGATGMPGFQQGIIDPEAYQSSNMLSARAAIPTLQYR